MSLAMSRRITGKENVTAPAKPTLKAAATTSVRSTSTSRARQPLAATSSLQTATTPGKPRMAAVAPTPVAPKSMMKPAVNSTLAAFGIPSVAEEVKGIVCSGLPEEYGADYGRIIAKKVPKKAITVNYKDHDAMVKQIMDDTKAALVDAVKRRDQAVDALKRFEDMLSGKLGDALQLQAALAEATQTRLMLESQLAEMKKQLEASKQETEVARQHESEANQEIDEANNMIAELEASVGAWEERIRVLEERVRDADAINKGLEDDKEELLENVAQLEAQIAEMSEVHQSELAGLKNSLESESTGARSKILQLTQEVEAATSKMQANSLRIAGLEKASSMTEVDIAKIKAERDAAVEAKLSLQDELERNRRQQDANQTGLMAAMEQFNRTQELHMHRERDLNKQIENHMERIQVLTSERDVLRASETSLKADLRDALARESTLSSQLAESRGQCVELRTELQAAKEEQHQLKTLLAETQQSLEKTQATFTSVKEDLEGKLSTTSCKLTEAEERLQLAADNEKNWAEKQGQWSRLQGELETCKAAQDEQIATLSNELATLRESAGATEESQLEKLCQVSVEAETLRRRVREMQTLKARLAEAEAAVAQLKEEAFEGELARRALHNQVQELKGNIRVYVRVRPVLSGDQELSVYAEDEEGMVDPAVATQLAISCAPDGTSLEITPPPPRGTKEGFAKRDLKPVSFAFDTVFGPRCNQEDVFNDVSHLVQSSLDGYNVCLFSYGQTGSGKTHTMQGGPGEQAGLIPRSVKQILETSQKMSSQGWKYCLEVAFLEIYNENIRDLLRIKDADKASTLSVHQDADGNVEVPGLTKVAVTDSDTIDMLLARAAKRRAVACTNMNEVSSRSHQVFTLYIRGEHAAKGIAVRGTLNLCDLAGSERLGKSGAEGDRKKETAAINKSLSCLADVFSALAKKSNHVPFRNSKLTYLLQPCFKGDGKTLMMVNLSPTLTSSHESLCSLRFAAQVSQVELGKPKRRVVEAISNDTAATDADDKMVSRTAADISLDDSYCPDADDSAHDDLEESMEMVPLPPQPALTATVSGVKRPAHAIPPAAPAAKRPATMPSTGVKPAATGAAPVRRGSTLVQSSSSQLRQVATTKYKTIR